MKQFVSIPRPISPAFLFVAAILVAGTPVLGAEAAAPPAEVTPRPQTADEPSPTSQSDATALELAGFRSLALMVFSSEPVGSQVLIDDEPVCFTPCHTGLPPGNYTVTFTKPNRKTVIRELEVTSSEQIQVHAVHGRRRPWSLIGPMYTVGGIFVAGGVASLTVHWGETGPQPIDSHDVPADERVFYRNLGIVSLVLGLPILGLATYLLATGSPSETRVTIAPKSIEVSLAPVFINSGTGLVLQGTF